MIRANSFNRFRVARNISGHLETLEYLNDILFQNVWLPVQIQLPTGSYSILFESQMDKKSDSASALAIDNVRIIPGTCSDGELWLLPRQANGNIVCIYL